MMRIRQRPACLTLPGIRPGLTLYEVVLSIAILLIGLTAISELISVGTQSSTRAKLRTDAAIHAESIMAEIVAGSREMEPVSDRPIFPEEETWRYDLGTEGVSAAESANNVEADSSKLIRLTLKVRYVGANGDVHASFTMNRIIRDPDLFRQAALDAAALDEEGSSDSSGSSSP